MTQKILILFLNGDIYAAILDKFVLVIFLIILRLGTGHVHAHLSEHVGSLLS